MDQVDLIEQEVYEDGKDIIPLVLNNDGKLEEDRCPEIDALGLKFAHKEICSKRPSILDTMQPCYNQLCDLESCPCRNKTSRNGFYENFAHHGLDFTEHSESCSSSPSSVTSVFDILMSLYSTKYFVENIKDEGATTDTTSMDTDTFIVEYPSGTRSVNDNINATEKTMFVHLPGATNPRTLLRSSLFFQFSTIGTVTGRRPARKSDDRQTKSLELANSKTKPSNNSPHKSKIVGEVPGSCKSAVSTNPYWSSSFAKSSVSKGLLQCKWRRGIPYFSFTMGSEIYLANPCKMESYVDKGFDYIYIFRSTIKEFRNHGSNTSEFVGKMCVSSSLVLDSNGARVVETEFVLIGTDQECSRELQNAASTTMKCKGLPKKLSEILRPNNSFKHTSNYKISEPSCYIDNLLHRPGRIESSHFDKSGLVDHLEDDPLSKLELATIVVKDYRQDSIKEVGIGGWGLKFLEGTSLNHIDTFGHPSCSDKGEREHKENKAASAVSLKVLIPAGFHGGHTTRAGLSSLTERWRSGHCDCGGWDIGCPLTVLNSKPIVSEDFPQQELLCKSVDFFIEGKDVAPSLKMVSIKEGVSAVYFQPTLSALQSLSIGIAVMYTQTPALYPKL